MSGSLSRYVFDMNTPETRRNRDIENHYHLERVAQSTQQIAQVQAASLAVQAASAQQMHRDLSKMSFGVDCMNQGIEHLQGQMAEVGRGVDEMNRTALRTEDALYNMGGMLDQWLSTISQQMADEQKTMERIADTLRRPLQTEVLEIRNHADHAMTSGMGCEGENRSEWYRDAKQLLHTAVENPIGKQDYVAWFQIGWLLWKADGNLPEAEQAFARAARLSTPNKDHYHVESLRHLAYIRYLQVDHHGAYQAIREAMEVSDSCAVIFDGARYSAVTSRHDEAIKLLEKCILREPPMIVRTLAEPDFSSIGDEVSDLVNSLRNRALAQAQAALQRWQQGLDTSKRAGETAECAVVIPNDVSQTVLDSICSEIGAMDYLNALTSADYAERARNMVLAVSVASLQKEAQRHSHMTSDLHKDIQSARDRAMASKSEAAHSANKSLAEAQAKMRDPMNQEASCAWCSVVIVGLVLLFALTLIYGGTVLAFGGLVLPIALALYIVLFAAPLTLRRKQKEYEQVYNESAAKSDAELGTTLGMLEEKMREAERRADAITHGLRMLSET